MHTFDKPNYRQKGKSSDGKLVKGFIQDAHQKLSSGTIPSKYETVILKNNNQKAFGSSCGRFFDQDDDTPAPGQYTSQMSNTTFSTLDTSTSVSKKGYGNGFASITARTTFTNKYLNSGPGPGSYEGMENSQVLSKPANWKGSSSFLNKGKSGAKSQSSQYLQSMRLENPGPAEYSLNPNIGKSVTSYNSAFISKTKRAQYLNLKPGPGAGEYNIKRTLIQKKPYPHVGVSSSFQPPTVQESHNNEMKKLTKFLDSKKDITVQGKVIQEDKKKIPGPGHYSEKFPEFQSEVLRSQSSSNFKDGIKNRFGDFVDQEKQLEKPVNPAPGHYKVENVVGFDTHYQQKAFVQAHFVMSETTRQPYGNFQDKLGPNPTIPFLSNKKKSYHLNLARNWV